MLIFNDDTLKEMIDKVHLEKMQLHQTAMRVRCLVEVPKIMI